MMVLDNAGKLEATRRGLANLLTEMESIRWSLHQDASAEEQNDRMNDGRHALGRVESTLTEMKAAMDMRPT